MKSKARGAGVASLPASIRVGYRTYHLETMTPTEAFAKERFGECDNCNGVIGICVDIPGVKAANTLLHEILHACWYVGDLEDEDKQERIVTGLANALTQVWRDNPALVAWLEAKLREK